MYIGLREKIMLIALAGLALLAYAVFSWMGLQARSSNYRPEIAAARRTLQAELAIGQIKGGDNVASQVAGDDVQAAMIGLPTSAITTDPGSLRSKVTGTNPNFAAAIVSMLRQAGVGRGDVVAVSYTGSFPALDIATVVSIETLGAEPVIVSSVGASTWGANDPDLTILDMETLLNQQGIIAHHSIEATMGGDFYTHPLTAEGRKLAADAIKRNGVTLEYDKSLAESVDHHMATYQTAANGRPIKAFVNVGGGLVSRGSGVWPRGFVTSSSPAPASNTSSGAPDGSDAAPAGLFDRMQQAGVPIINLTDIRNLATDYRLPVNPASTPPIGDGGVYRNWTQVRIVAGLLLVALAAVLFFARFVLLAATSEGTVDTYFGTAPRSFAAWIRSFGIRLPLRPAPSELPVQKD